VIIKQVIRYDNAPALEATWVDENDVVVKCHAYSNAQMAELAADLGDDAPQYQELMDEIAATYVPPEPELTAVPAQVTMRQARLALLGAGLLQTVNDAIATMPGTEGEAARIEWEYALSVDRNSQLVAGMTSALNLSEEQLDALFITAASL